MNGSDFFGKQNFNLNLDMKTQKEIMSEIESLKNYQNIIQDRIKSGNPNKGDKATVKTIKGDIKTLQWVLTP